MTKFAWWLVASAAAVSTLLLIVFVLATPHTGITYHAPR